MCVFVYQVDNQTEPAQKRAHEVHRSLSWKCWHSGFQKNERGEPGTRTSTLHKEGVSKLRSNWIYLLE
jgi:hypothetical protein